VTVVIRAALPADSDSVLALLREAGLPTDGVPADLADFLVATTGREVVGAVGLERYGDAALLRSAAVREALRGTGVGDALVHAVLELARARAVRDLVLLTTTADRWFPRFGFERTSREAVPAAVHASAEFQGACPASAVVMRRAL
jgi:amino-acid N-acetyltransferase